MLEAVNKIGSASSSSPRQIDASAGLGNVSRIVDLTSPPPGAKRVGTDPETGGALACAWVQLIG